MRHRLCLGGLVGLLILAVGYAYASPFLTISRVRSAATRGDTDTVSAHVDFPALRQSFKDTLGAAMIGTIDTEGPRNQYAAFSMAMTMVMADKMVEAMVTPTSVSAMVQGRRPQAAARNRPPTSDTDVTTLGYETMDRFVVKVARKNDPTDSFTMVWKRSGLTWQLSAVRFSDPARAASVARYPGGRAVRPIEPRVQVRPYSSVAPPPLQPAERPRWLAEEEAQAQQEARDRREGREPAQGDWEIVLIELERKSVGELDPRTAESSRDSSGRIDNQQALALAQELNGGNFQRHIVVASSPTRESCLVTAGNLAQRAATFKDKRYDLEDGLLLVTTERRLERSRPYRAASLLSVRMWKCVRADKQQAGAR